MVERKFQRALDEAKVEVVEPAPGSPFDPAIMETRAVYRLLIGSVVALQTIGPAFFADPKVLLSLAMWVVYVAMIYIRRHSGLRGRRAIYLSSFSFVFVLAVWAANASRPAGSSSPVVRRRLMRITSASWRL